MYLHELKAEHIARYKAAKLKDEYDPKTINNQVAMLRRMLVIAVEWGKIPHIPAIKWQLRVPPPTFDFLDFDEAERLIHAADPDLARPWSWSRSRPASVTASSSPYGGRTSLAGTRSATPSRRTSSCAELH
jgi:integrase